jgi:hypothetical protein
MWTAARSPAHMGGAHNGKMENVAVTGATEKATGSQQHTRGARARGMQHQQSARVRVQESAGEVVHWHHGMMRGMQFGWRR